MYEDKNAEMTVNHRTPRRKLKVVHISFDFPDDINPHKTHAIKRLVESASGLSHVVFSLNRTASRLSYHFAYNHGVYTIRLFGLPRGVLSPVVLRHFATQLAKIIVRDLLEPDIIHAHKLTFEGVIAYFLAKNLGVPYVCTIRGDSDLKMIRKYPQSRDLYGRILRDASHVFFLAPWARKVVPRLLGITLDSNNSLLPNIVPFEATLPVAPRTRRFVSVFRLKSYRRKNIVRVLLALRRLYAEGVSVGLDIIGGGRTAWILRTCIRVLGLSRNVTLIGRMEPDELKEKYRDYLGLVLPSLRETFGMVYLEALGAGIPILYSKDVGVDGYFDDHDVGVKVNPYSVSSISAAMSSLLEHNDYYRLEVARIFREGGMNRFSGENIVRLYEDSLRRVLGGNRIFYS